MKIGRRINPSDRCSHDKPTATSGGLIFVVMFFINYTYFYHLGLITLSPYILGSFLLIGITGLIDDYHHLPYKTRFVIQFVISFFIIKSGLKVEMPFFQGNLYSLDYFLSIFLIIGLINASNFFDGLNGLLSGCVLILLSFSYFFISTSQKPFILLIFIPLVVFYVFNFPKAKLFMGDTGSTFLGLFLAILALQNQGDYTFPTETVIIHKGLIYTLTPMMFCWFDVAITLFRRIIENRNIFTPWRDYLFHHLFEIGYKHEKIALIYYASLFCLSGVSYCLMYKNMPFFIGMLIYGLLQIIFMIGIIKKHRKKYVINFDDVYINEDRF